MARRRDVSWSRIAKALGLRDGRDAQRHHRRLVDLVGDNSAVGGQP
jgi:deoxyxylulose-5-phosphate synthase